MERKIGEIFEYNGEWYQCIVGCHCPDCAFCNNNCEERERITLGNKLTKEETTGFCTPEFREDGKSVIFKKLEKVGEPYEFDGHLFQSYRTFEVPIFTENYATVRELGNNSKISIEIKQTKEDMEDLDKIKVRDYTKVEELNVMEENKLNLKPFDLQKAREGKPVCTRDGRKARIICFDAKRKDKKSIIALVPSNDYPGFEDLIAYYNNGNYHGGHENDGDLMMLPEKKEGWINIIKTEDGGYCCKGEVNSDYNDAFIENINVLDNRGITVRIEWEE